MQKKSVSTCVIFNSNEMKAVRVFNKAINWSHNTKYSIETLRQWIQLIFFFLKTYSTFIVHTFTVVMTIEIVYSGKTDQFFCINAECHA